MKTIIIYSILLSSLAANAQTNPITNGLKLKLLADSGFTYVSTTNATWTDKSGSGNNMMWRDGDAPNQITKNGKKAIKFNQGLIENVSLNSSFANPEATVFFVTDDSINLSPVSIAETNSVDNEFLIQGNAILHHSSMFNFEGKTHPCYNKINKDTIRIITGVWKQAIGNSNILHFMNGTKSTTNSTTYGSPSSYSSVNRNIYIGGRNKQGGSSLSQREYYNGNVYEVLGYNRALLDSEVMQVTNYLKLKYNVKSTACVNTNANIENSKSENEITAYPNPASDYAMIKYDLQYANSNSSIKIYSIEGVLINEINLDPKKKIGEYMLDLSNYSNQIYYFSLSVDGVQSKLSKLIVIK